MSEEVLNLKLDALLERVEKLEDHHNRCGQPEEGTLAKMRQNIDLNIGKVESKLNWLITLIMTTVVGALVTIVMAKLGYK